MPRTVRRPTKKVGTLSFGPVLGIRDSADPTVSADPQRAVIIENMHPVELDKPTAFVGRPGLDQAGDQGGSAGARTTQLIYQFTKRDGTEYTVRIVGGKLETYNWSTEAWSNVVTAANLSSASITLSSTARCYAVTYTDKMVISDGVNTPWMWDGTSGAGGLTKLTNAPVFYGQPWVHYAKLFGIKNTARSTIVWSEENDATTGYEAGGYTNAWQLTQTEQEGFFAGASMDDALIMLRAYSATAITGAVNATFSTTGTREAVSQTIGTPSPAGVAIHDNKVYFTDSHGRPQVIVGGKVMDPPFWNDIRELIIALDRSLLSWAITIYDPDTRLILYGLVELGQSYPSLIIAVNPTLNIPVAVWRGFVFQYIAVVKNATGVPTLMHGDDSGYSYDHGHVDGTLWSDELNAGTVAIRHVIEGPHLGVSASDEKQFIRADVLMRAESDATEISFNYYTPYGPSSVQTGEVESAASRYDVDDYDDNGDQDSFYAGETVERKKSFGILGTGRWMRPRVSHEVLGERFGFAGVKVHYVSAGDNPLIP